MWEETLAHCRKAKWAVRLRVGRCGCVLLSLSKAVASPVVNVAQYIRCTLGRFNVRIGSLHRLYPFVNPPLLSSFQSFCRFASRRTGRTARGCQRHFTSANVCRGGLCSNVGSFLRRTAQRKHVLVLTASGPAIFTGHVLSCFSVTHCFAFITNDNLSNSFCAGKSIVHRMLRDGGLASRLSIIVVNSHGRSVVKTGRGELSSVNILCNCNSQRRLSRTKTSCVMRSVTKLHGLLFRR